MYELLAGIVDNLEAPDLDTLPDAGESPGEPTGVPLDLPAGRLAHGVEGDVPRWAIVAGLLALAGWVAFRHFGPLTF